LVKLFSHDGVRWFSDPVEAPQNQKRRQQFLQQQAQLIKKSAHFKYGEPRRIKGGSPRSRNFRKFWQISLVKKYAVR